MATLTTQQSTSLRRVSGLVATIGTVVLMLFVTLVIRPDLNPTPDTILVNPPSFLRGAEWLRWVVAAAFVWLPLFVATWVLRGAIKYNAEFTLRKLIVLLATLPLLSSSPYAVSRGWYASIEHAVLQIVVSMLIFALIGVVLAFLVVLCTIIEALYHLVWTDWLADSAFAAKLEPVFRYFRADEVTEPTPETLEVDPASDVLVK